MPPIIPRLSFLLPRRLITPNLPLRALPQCPFTTTSALTKQRVSRQPLPPRPGVDESEIVESFLKGSGPGGQKINKTDSAVQLKHLPTGIVVKSQATRSRSLNRMIARRILGEKLEHLANPTESRVAKVIERKVKKKSSADKKKRRKYRKLAEEKAMKLAEENGEMMRVGAVDAALGRELDSLADGEEEEVVMEEGDEWIAVIKDEDGNIISEGEEVPESETKPPVEIPRMDREGGNPPGSMQK